MSLFFERGMGFEQSDLYTILTVMPGSIVIRDPQASREGRAILFMGMYLYVCQQQGLTRASITAPCFHGVIVKHSRILKNHSC